MFELLCMSSDGKVCSVLDTNDFSVEHHFLSNIKKFLESGVEIKGIKLSKKNNSICADNVKKYLIYNDDKFAFLASCTESNNQYTIEIVPRYGDRPSYHFNYDSMLTPKVRKRLSDIYEIELFCNGTGFSVCVISMGNGIIKPIYKDKNYVNRFPELSIQFVNNTYKFSRD